MYTDTAVISHFDWLMCFLDVKCVFMMRYGQKIRIKLVFSMQKVKVFLQFMMVSSVEVNFSTDVISISSSNYGETGIF